MTIKEIQDNIFYPNRDYTTPEKAITASVEEKKAYLGEWSKFIYGRGKKNIPTRLQQIIDENIAAGNDIWKYATTWYTECIFYKGDVNTTSDWLFITNGGNYYKVGAKYSVWETRTWIDREKVPYSEATRGLKETCLFLGCEPGPMSRVCEQLALYYFGLNYLNSIVPSAQVR